MVLKCILDPTTWRLWTYHRKTGIGAPFHRPRRQTAVYLAFSVACGRTRLLSQGKLPDSDLNATTELPILNEKTAAPDAMTGNGGLPGSTPMAKV
jgi:hypothetical protein